MEAEAEESEKKRLKKIEADQKRKRLEEEAEKKEAKRLKEESKAERRQEAEQMAKHMAAAQQAQAKQLDAAQEQALFACGTFPGVRVPVGGHHGSFGELRNFILTILFPPPYYISCICHYSSSSINSPPR